MKDVSAVVLAAGKGSRLKGNKPKVLKILGGQPIIIRILKLLDKLKIQNRILVLGHRSNTILDKLLKSNYKENILIQKEPQGTAHSLQFVIRLISTKEVLVLYGDDSGLYRPQTIKNFVKYHINSGNKATFMVSKVNQKTDIGGILLDKKGYVMTVVTRSQMEEHDINQIRNLCGAFCFNSQWISKNISNIPKSEISGEYPLPGIIKIANSQEVKIGSYLLPDQNEWNSLNTNKELIEARKKMKKKLQIKK